MPHGVVQRDLVAFRIVRDNIKVAADLCVSVTAEDLESDVGRIQLNRDSDQVT